MLKYAQTLITIISVNIGGKKPYKGPINGKRSYEYERTEDLYAKQSDGGLTFHHTRKTTFRANLTLRCPNGWRLRVERSAWCVKHIEREDECAEAGNPINFSTFIKKEYEKDFYGKFSSVVKRNYHGQFSGWDVLSLPKLLIDSNFPSSHGAICKEGVSANQKLSYLLADDSISSTQTFSCSAFISHSRTSNNYYITDTNQYMHLPHRPGIVLRKSLIVSLTEDVDSSGWVVTKNNGWVEHFNSSGNLTQLKKNGNSVYNITYEFNRPIKISLSGSAEELTIEYNDSGRISKITQNANFSVSYEYGTINQSNLVRLEKVSINDELYKHYLYENTNYPLAITGLIDARGKRYATWAYNEDGFAISSEHGEGQEKTTIEYKYVNASSTFRVTEAKVTNSLGKSTTYTLDVISNANRVVSVEGHPTDNCAAANKAYTYFADGTLKTKTDWQGRITEYLRDGYGRETQRTEAVGTDDARTIKTEYHPTLHLKTKVIDPKTTTEWEYYDDGKLKNTKTYATAN